MKTKINQYYKILTLVYQKLTFPRDITNRIQRRSKYVLIFFCFVHSAFGQVNTCREYKNTYDALLDIRNTDPINYQQHQLKSSEAANYLELCLKDRTDRGEVNDTEYVESTYMIGKLFRDGGKCDLAYDYFLKCMANTMSASLTPNYYDLANALKNTCVVPDVHASARGDNYRVRIINYSGKGGLNRNYFLNDIDLNEFTDNTPYFSDEIETLARRRFSLADTSNAISQLAEASNASCYVYKKPFLLILVSGMVYQNALNPKLSDGEELDGEMMEATYEQYKRPASVQYLENLYENLVEPAVTRFSHDYFNQFTTEHIIPIYIFDHPFNAAGARLYAEFTDLVHFRMAAGKVGYYNQFDGSLVTWINSGGGTFIHEFVHLMMDHDAAADRIPYWLNEGMASLYEETRNFRPLNNWRLVYIKKSMEVYNSFADIGEMLALDDFSDEYERLITDAYARYFCKYLYDRDLLDEIYNNIRNSTIKPGKYQQIELIQSVLGQPMDSIQLDFSCRIRDNNNFGSWNFDEYIHEVAQYVAQEGKFPLEATTIDFTSCPEKETIEQPEIMYEFDDQYPVQQTEPIQNQMQQLQIQHAYPPNQGATPNQSVPPNQAVSPNGIVPATPNQPGIPAQQSPPIPNQPVDTQEMEQMPVQLPPAPPKDSTDQH